MCFDMNIYNGIRKTALLATFLPASVLGQTLCPFSVSTVVISTFVGTMALFLVILAIYLLTRRIHGQKVPEGTKSGYDNPLVLTQNSISEHSAKELVDSSTQTEELPEAKEEKIVESLIDFEENKVEPEIFDETPKQNAPPPLQRRKSRDDIKFKSGWRKSVKLQDLLDAKLIPESRVRDLELDNITEEEVERELQPYLIGQFPIAGIYDDPNERTLSLYDAHKQGIISRGTALSLLEAQAAVGSIIDPISGKTMGVSEALDIGLLDRHFAAVLTRAERAVHGYKERGSNETLSLFQAMKKGLIVEKHGIRLLEAQIATGGIIDPVANHRLPVETAFERGLFDEHLHATLEDPSDDTKGFLDPNTNENLTYLELITRCVVDPYTTFSLLPLVKPEEKVLYKTRELNNSIGERLKSRSSSTGYD